MRAQAQISGVGRKTTVERLPGSRLSGNTLVLRSVAGGAHEGGIHLFAKPRKKKHSAWELSTAYTVLVSLRLPASCVPPPSPPTTTSFELLKIVTQDVICLFLTHRSFNFSNRSTTTLDRPVREPPKKQHVCTAIAEP